MKNEESNNINLILDKLPLLFNNLKEANFLTDREINSKFMAVINEIKEHMTRIYLEFKSFDSKPHTKEEQISKIIDRKPEIFGFLDEKFKDVWDIAQNMSKQEYRIHQLYIQRELIPLLGLTPLNKRIYEKPLGYPGDFQTINYYYEDGYEGDSSFDVLLHRYTLELEVSRAHINRKTYFKSKIDETIKNVSGPVNITSFGCGAALEIIEYIKGNNPKKTVVFNLVDSEKLALEYVKNKLSDIKHNQNIKINYYNMDILGLIKKSKIYESLKNQHLLYAAGLFDYFKDKTAISILNAMYELLSENGRLIIVNVNKDHGARAYMELLGEWHLYLRNEDNLLALADSITTAKDKHIEKIWRMVKIYTWL